MTGELITLSDFLATYGRQDEDQREASESHREFLENTFARIRKRLEQRISEARSNEALAIFIKVTQLQLTERADTAYNAFLQYHRSGNAVAGTFRDIHEKLLDILQYLYRHHTDHFDHSLAIPEGMPQLRAEESACRELINGLERHGVDGKLTRLLANLLCEEKGMGEGMSWAQHEYRTKIAKQLDTVLVEPDGDADSTIAAIKVLVACNVNSITFYNYMLSYIDRITEANATFEEKEEELENLLRKMERIRITQNMAYQAKTPHIGESVKGCISHELDRLKRTKKSANRQQAGNRNDPNKGFYFNVAATIEELLLVAWLMIEVGFIKTVKQSRLYAFIQNHIKTERTDNPSPRYMRNHYGPNNANLRSIRNVRAWLMLMVNVIDTRLGEQKTR